MQRVPLSVKKRLAVMNASKDLHEVLLDLAKGLEHARHPLPEAPDPVCQVDFQSDPGKPLPWRQPSSRGKRE